MHLDDCVFFSLTTAARRASKYWKQHVTGFGVTGVQAMVLHALQEGDRILSVELGERTQLDSATLTGVLDRLERDGLIERQRHDRDRRAILICLTPQGRELAEQIHPVMEQANRSFTGNLSDAELEQLKALLARL
ncbi:MarR family winged helix-turn-helix transcriptional regulator [Marinobacterium arenosum]|uniref:MarR family winged helix-turn-helix transcriptional regulator n=1 Tax=Marinobacterium arenosum TaxID=2862496 RepID=UPI001C937A73|nr:MarR family transcriptional regulator [Marinobacterium arenosum]MBY4677426.1 MarR family transcriptional regulator [Marinobacterium arenosum]